MQVQVYDKARAGLVITTVGWR